MTVRLAVEGDLPAIVAIYNQAVAIEAVADLEPVTVESRRLWFVEHAPDRHPILVAERDGVVAGWLSLSAYRPGRGGLRHTLEVSYFVDTESRRSGVGSALLEVALERCPALGVKTLFAILLEDNAGSVQLLERFGFERWGHLPGVADFGGREVGQLYYGRRVGA